MQFDVEPILGHVDIIRFEYMAAIYQIIAVQEDPFAGSIYILDNGMFGGTTRVCQIGSFELILDTTPPQNFDADFRISSLSEENNVFTVKLSTSDEDTTGYEVFFDGMNYEVLDGVSLGNGWFEYKEVFTLRIIGKFVTISVRCRDNVWNESRSVPEIKFMYPSGTIQAWGDLLLDTTPPIGEVVINDGAKELYTTAIKLDFTSYSEDMIEVKMWGPFVDDDHEFAAETEVDAPWIKFPYILFMRITPNLGMKRFFFKFRDNVWNESEPFILEIELVPLSIDVSDLQYFTEESLVTMPLISRPAN